MDRRFGIAIVLSSWAFGCPCAKSQGPSWGQQQVSIPEAERSLLDRPSLPVASRTSSLGECAQGKSHPFPGGFVALNGETTNSVSSPHADDTGWLSTATFIIAEYFSKKRTSTRRAPLPAELSVSSPIALTHPSLWLRRSCTIALALGPRGLVTGSSPRVEPTDLSGPALDHPPRCRGTTSANASLRGAERRYNQPKTIPRREHPPKAVLLVGDN